MEGFVVGTPDYIAPEQARGLGVTPKSDLYSLGVMAYEMVSGQLPFMAASAIDIMSLHVNEPAPRVGSVTDGVPAPLEELIAQLLLKEPRDRPESADLVRRKLAGLKRSLREGATHIGESPSGAMSKATEPFAPISELPTESGEPVRLPDTETNKSQGSGRWMLGAALLALVLVLVAFGFFYPRGPPKPQKPPPIPIQTGHYPTPGESSPPPEEPLAAPEAPVDDVVAPLSPDVPGASKATRQKLSLTQRKEALSRRLSQAYDAVLLKAPVKGLDRHRAQTEEKIAAATSDAELQQATRDVEAWEKRGRRQ
jgi:serine/threonine protein kinase